jgi:hypothetical protein
VLRELDLCLECCDGSDALCFNLFSVCGYHIAEALGIPCMLVTPTLAPPSASTAAHAAAFSRHFPTLHEQLCSTTSIAASVPADGASADSQHPVSMQDVVHWMLPLFSARYSFWRLKHKIPSFPMHPRASGPSSTDSHDLTGTVPPPTPPHPTPPPTHTH